MAIRSEVWTYFIVTAVALFIWFWAAVETREKDNASFHVYLAPSDPAAWVLRTRDLPETGYVTVKVELEGSRFSLQRARELDSIKLIQGDELPSDPGIHPEVNLVDALNKHLRDTGVRVLSSVPKSIHLTIDKLVTVTASIRPVLPQLETEGPIEVKPTEAEVTLPSRLRESLGNDLIVEARVSQARLDELEPGEERELPAGLYLPATPGNPGPVTIKPNSATITLTVRSRIRETTLPTVRVQIGGPPEDQLEYIIEIDELDKQLRDVTIRADAALISQIERRDVKVVALLHLTTSDKDQRIKSKPISCFMAVPDVGRATIVQAEVGGSARMPIIHFRVIERQNNRK
ncbi:MAG: hypothetical protein IH888_00005 [Planctomycetes bacterium]|nr:hypothetical protein [Planctomycetota bacterium]